MKKITFKAPQGFAPPEDFEPGKPFDVVATVTLSPEGEVTIVALDEASIGEETAEKEAPTEEASFLDKVEEGMA